MKAAVKVTPTNYAGVSFRSRTEARWAVFFDAIGLRWEYEAEGYQLGAGWYLPDFWLPDMGIHAEVKPDTGPTDADAEKVAELALSERIVVLTGSPWPGWFVLYGPGSSDGELVQWSTKYGASFIQSPHDGEARFYYAWGQELTNIDEPIEYAMSVARSCDFLESR